MDKKVGIAMKELERSHPGRPGWIRGEPGERSTHIDDQAVKQALADLRAKHAFGIDLCLKSHSQHECGRDDCPADAVCVTVLRKARNEIRAPYIRGAIEKLIRGRMSEDAIGAIEERAYGEFGVSHVDVLDLCIADCSFECIMDILEHWGLIEHGQKADTWRETPLGMGVRHSLAEQEQGR